MELPDVHLPIQFSTPFPSLSSKHIFHSFPLSSKPLFQIFHTLSRTFPLDSRMCIIKYTYHRKCLIPHRDNTIILCNKPDCFSDMPVTTSDPRPIRLTDRILSTADDYCRRCRIKQTSDEESLKQLIQEKELFSRYCREKAQRPLDYADYLILHPTIYLTGVFEGHKKWVRRLSIIVNLPIVNNSELSAEDRSCAICCQDYRNADGFSREEAVMLPCGHRLGNLCAGTWYGPMQRTGIAGSEEGEMKVGSCPFCRHPLLTVHNNLGPWTTPEA